MILGLLKHLKLKGSKTTNINLKRNEKTYIISVDYRHHTILSCYANNILTFKIDLSNSLLCTILCENYAIITVYRRSQKHNLNEQCSLIVDKDCAYIELQCYSTNTKNYTFIDFVKEIQRYNNIKQ